jgi:hypothetical protein
MPLDWSALVFVEKYRLRAVRGVVVGAWRVGERTYFDLRVTAPEWSTSHPASFADLRLLDAGDVLREKHVALLSRIPVIVEPRALSIARAERQERSYSLQPLRTAQRIPNARRVLDLDSYVCGDVEENDGERHIVVNVGFSAVVRASDPTELAEFKPGDWVEFANQLPARGFVLAG